MSLNLCFIRRSTFWYVGPTRLLTKTLRTYLAIGRPLAETPAAMLGRLAKLPRTAIEQRVHQFTPSLTSGGSTASSQTNSIVCFIAASVSAAICGVTLARCTTALLACERDSLLRIALVESAVLYGAVRSEQQRCTFGCRGGVRASFCHQAHQCSWTRRSQLPVQSRSMRQLSLQQAVGGNTANTCRR